jgi:S-adenosylmethionine decarboxylase
MSGSYVRVFLTLYDVPIPELMMNLGRGRTVLEELIRELRLHIVTQSGFQYPSNGYAHTFTLSRGHITIHSFPELQLCYVDLFCCNSDVDPVYAIERVKRKFNTENVQSQIIRR